MNTENMKMTRKQAKPIIERAFPEYNGRKIQVVFTDHMTPCDLNWGGGTKNTYAFLNVNGEIMRYSPAAPWIEVNEDKRIEIQPNVLIVKHSIFCGHDTGITIYAHPDLAQKMLTAA